FGEVRMVQDVEELASQLHADSLGGLPRLNQRKVPVLEFRPSKRVPAAIPEVPEIRLRQNPINRHRASRREVGDRCRIPYNVPAVAELPGQAGIILKVCCGKGSASLKRDNRVYLPALEPLPP